jgi:hypothetical protein
VTADRPRRPRPRISIPRSAWIGALIVCGGVVAAVVLLLTHWPLTKDAIAHDLEKTLGMRVEIGTFHRSYFPPGCVAERVMVADGRSQRPLVTIQKLEVRASYAGMLSTPKRIPRLTLGGMRVVFPSNRPGALGGLLKGGKSKSGNSLVISTIEVRNAALEFDSDQPGGNPYRLSIVSLDLRNVGSGAPIAYRTRLINSVPPGAIKSEGRIGPWSSGNPGAMMVSGSFTYEHVNLGVFRGISGTLNARGKFNGRLDRIATEGNLEVADFHVSGSGHNVPLRTSFHAVVNGTNGDTTLEPADARLLGSEVVVRGPIASRSQASGKTATFVLAVPSGRIQDFLLLFLKDKIPPMDGEMRLRANVVWPPGPLPFIRKLRLDGDFGIDHSHFKPATGLQKGIDRLSGSAQGESKQEEKEGAPIAPAEVHGHVSLRDGVATLSNVSFRFTGAEARIAGTYNLVNQRVNLRGTLVTSGHLSATTSGIKAVLAKLIAPLFKKGHSVKSVPFKVTGVHGNASISIDWGRGL